MQTPQVPIHGSWRLNERHYGALQGLNKAETAEKFGAEQVKLWRRSYSTRPPAMEEDDPRHPRHDPRYADLSPSDLPSAESLEDTFNQFLPHWNQTIAPAIEAGEHVLIVSHGNSQRALAKYLDRVSDEDIVGLNIATGIPLVYELDEDLGPVKHYYLEKTPPEALAL